MADTVEAVTITSAKPEVVAGGVEHVIAVLELTSGFVQAFPPTVTVDPAVKFVPVIDMDSLPARIPNIGDTLVIVGVGGT